MKRDSQLVNPSVCYRAQLALQYGIHARACMGLCITGGWSLHNDAVANMHVKHYGTVQEGCTVCDGKYA
jgi:hypothetical protein